jgi:hypothetical protein
MITIVRNKVNRSLDILLDANGADLLIQRLQKLKTRGDHLHGKTQDPIRIARTPVQDTRWATSSPVPQKLVERLSRRLCVRIHRGCRLIGRDAW